MTPTAGVLFKEVERGRHGRPVAVVAVYGDGAVRRSRIIYDQHGRLAGLGPEGSAAEAQATRARRQRAWYDDDGTPRWFSGPGRTPRLEWSPGKAALRAQKTRRRWARRAMGVVESALIDAEAVFTKEDVNYRYSGDPQRACGVCAHFIAPGACDRTLGLIRRVDVCNLFEPRGARP